MNRADALDLAWGVGTPIIVFLGFIAVLLLGLAVIGQVRR